MCFLNFLETPFRKYSEEKVAQLCLTLCDPMNLSTPGLPVHDKLLESIQTLVLSRHGKQMGKQWKQCQTLFWGAPKSLQMVIAAMKLKDAYSLEGKL